MSRPVETKRDHYLWQEIVVARPDITDAHKLVAWRLALYRNLKTGRCDPRKSELARGSANCVRTTQRAIAEFIRLGFMELERSGGGRSLSNRYRLLIPSERVTDVSPLDASEGVSDHGEKGDRESRKGDRPGQERVTELWPTHKNYEENTKREHSSVEASAVAEARSKGAGELSKKGKQGRKPNCHADQAIDIWDASCAARVRRFDERWKAGNFSPAELEETVAELQDIADERGFSDRLGRWAQRLSDEMRYYLANRKET